MNQQPPQPPQQQQQIQQQQQQQTYPTQEECQISLTNEQIILQLIENNDIEQLKEWGIKSKNINFLESYPEIELDQKISPLILAAYLARYDLVRMILENPTLDIDIASDQIGHTPLTVACITGNFEIVKLLVESGAEVNKPTSLNITPFMCCFQRLLEEETNVFENRKICLKMAELLLQFGADINWIIDKQKGYTILMQFCAVKMEMTAREKENNYEIIKFLIENGADKNIKNHKGRSAIDLINKHCNKEYLQELIDSSQQLYFWNKVPLRNSSQKSTNTSQIQSDIRPKSKSMMKFLSLCKN